MTRRRRGFVLLAVLWVMVGIAAIALGVLLEARLGVASARNRANLVRSAWRAEECAERARALIAEGMVGGRGWGRLDELVAASPVVRDCDVRIEAAGARLDVNAASGEMIAAYLQALGTAPARADSLTSALLDWRDADDVARPLGAESAWYERRGETPPRNAPLADSRELALVRGFLAVRGADTLFGVEPGRIPLNHAPLALVAALPGLGAEALSRVAEHRVNRVPITDLLVLASELSPDARAVLLARYADLLRVVTVEPDAWILSTRGRTGAPRVTVALELRLVRAGERAAVVRRRSWAE